MEQTSSPHKRSHVLLWLTFLQEKRKKLVKELARKRRTNREDPRVVIDGALETT